MGLFNAGIFATVLCSAFIYSTVGAISVTNTNPIAVREDASGALFNINAAGATSYTLNDPTNTFLVDASTGVVSLRADEILDCESQQNYTVTVEASDGTDTATVTLTISLIDVNDEPPTYLSNNQALKCIIHGQPIGVYRATDIDCTSPNNKITYSVTVLSGVSGGVTSFEIDNGGGLIAKTKATPASYGLYLLLVKATDMGEPPLTGTTTVTATLTSSAGCTNFENSAAFISGTLVTMTTALLHASLEML